MIQATDLRVGNLVLSNNPLHRKDWLGKVLSILEIKDESVSVVAIDELPYAFTGGQFLKYINPLPITEDILLKCGFGVSVNGWHSCPLGKLEFGFKSEGVLILMDWDLEIKYLHQLQNLYYALTNKELTINL